LGGLFGYSSPNSSFYRAIKGEKDKIFPCDAPTRRKVPPSQGVSSGPNITAFHNMILLSQGAPLIPEGGSFCNLLKSRISLLRAGVDITCFFLLSCFCFVFFSLSFCATFGEMKLATPQNPVSFLFCPLEHGHRRSCQRYSFSAPPMLFTVRAAFDEVATKKATHVWVKPYQGSKDTEGLHQFLFFLKPEATGVHEGVKLREGMIFF